MELTHQPLIYIFNNVLDYDIQKGIENFISLLIDTKEKYKTDNLWVIDQKIGGIGAYTMPSDPTFNPFPSGVERSLYRPLQYARCDIDICDIRMHGRNIVQNCGMHLETVCRLVLRYYKVFGDLRFNNTTLGKAVSLIRKLNIFDNDIIAALENFVKIYNISKHEVNQDETRERLFNAYEAITAYYAARILGVELLRKINYPNCNEIFDIIHDKQNVSINSLKEELKNVVHNI